MKSVFLYALFLLTASCATSQKSPYTALDSPATKASANDSSLVKVPWGTVLITTTGYSGDFGLQLQFELENQTDKDISFNSQDILVMDNQNIAYNKMTDAEISLVANKYASLGAAIAGGSTYSNQQASSSNLQSGIFQSLLKDGTIPGKSKKIGHLYFPKNSATKEFKVRLLKTSFGADVDTNFRKK
ncbi:hypothetical protein [Bdellovibrio sp.]|uniref:hypothetical protein n=1 Tax=Bdellovibrio sp. TaxID=28201 RepID=UPI003221845B